MTDQRPPVSAETSRTANAPIFIVGTERSGSNLLRLILNSHASIFVPHPPHIMMYFHELEKGYGDLGQEPNLLRLIEDVGRLIRYHIYPWEIAPTPEQVLPRVAPRDLFGVFSAYYDLYLDHRGKKRWGCKSTFMIHHADRILDKYPDAQLLWLVRDPRDVAVSSKTSVFNPCHPHLTAKLWREQQQLGYDLEQRLPAGNLLRLRYEDLISQPEEWVHRICQFLNEPFDEQMLRFFETEDAKKGGQLSESWVNHTRPIMSNNFGKYRKSLRQEEIRWIEAEAWQLMETLGYELEYPDAPQHPPREIERSRFELADQFCRIRIELRSLSNDKNHWQRWRRGVYLQYLKMLYK